MCIQCRVERSCKYEGGGGEISLGSTVNFTGAVGDSEAWFAAVGRPAGREMLGSTCPDWHRDGAVGVLCLRDRRFLGSLVGESDQGDHDLPRKRRYPGMDQSRCVAASMRRRWDPAGQ